MKLSKPVKITFRGKDGIEYELSGNSTIDIDRSGDVETTVYEVKRPATISFTASKPLNRFWKIMLNTIAIWKRK